ncbi:choline/ethanolamine kinase-like [Argiope bruennichi]|uniref:Choline/ethanolamine kinase like protein n=1 Tax=Argiope bruennichi TaxID=94029 RepID=A0A8T0FZM5_ARGBR|nr:choline/ethanolamine kinase-like [Argiope bruennichi]KAF8796491.1 Choline/ethanolamine kinase like protein [Argiope bruennichi]
MTTLTAEELESTKNEALTICQDFLGDIWSELSISDFEFSIVSGGLSNNLYRCALSDNIIVKNPKIPRQVLLRIYGPLQEDVNVVVTEAATFMLLAERKLGPKLYGVFPNGRLEEFIPSRTLLCKDYRLMYATIARKLAKIHALDVPIKKTPDFFPVNMKKWLADVENDSKEKKNKIFEHSDMYNEEINWLSEEMKKSNSPVVYCHNDLQGGNILLREDSPSDEEPKIMLIDFEFGAYNYRGFDLANQFAEWCFDYNTGEYPYFEYNSEKFPTKEEQISYIRVYLDQLVEEGVLRPESIENEIKVILQEIDLFSMAVHLLWSLWSWKMTFRSCMDFAHREHGKTRLSVFMTLKKKFLSRALVNGDSEP